MFKAQRNVHGDRRNWALWAWRRAQGLSIAEAAARAGVHRQSWFGYESGGRTALDHSLRMTPVAQRILALLGRPVEEVFAGDVARRMAHLQGQERGMVRWRVARQLSVAEAAREAGVCVSVWYNLEGGRCPAWTRLGRLARDARRVADRLRQDGVDAFGVGARTAAVGERDAAYAAAGVSQRKRSILAYLHGIDGGGGHTLEEAARHFGISRQCVHDYMRTAEARVARFQEEGSMAERRGRPRKWDGLVMAVLDEWKPLATVQAAVPELRRPEMLLARLRREGRVERRLERRAAGQRGRDRYEWRACEKVSEKVDTAAGEG